MPLAVGEQSLYCLDTSEDPAIYRMDLKNAELLAAVRGPDAAAAVGMAKAPLHGLLYVAGMCLSPVFSPRLLSPCLLHE